MNIQQTIAESIEIKQNLLSDTHYIEAIRNAVDLMEDAYKNDKKVLFCGNGGSAADAQHIAAELSGRFFLDRRPLYAEALHVNTSFVTSVANDYSYLDVFSRMVEASGRDGDILVAISTSGNSENVVRAMLKAREQSMKIIAFTGMGGGKMKELTDILISIPSKNTPRIQECHIMTGHIICEMVEKELFGEEN